jgi:hypothetical protein
MGETLTITITITNPKSIKLPFKETRSMFFKEP